MFSNTTLVFFNPETTLSVFFNMYRLDTSRSKRNKAKVHVQLIYILGYTVHVNNMDR